MLETVPSRRICFFTDKWEKSPKTRARTRLADEWNKGPQTRNQRSGSNKEHDTHAFYVNMLSNKPNNSPELLINKFVYNTTILLDPSEPNTITEALRGPESRKWRDS